MDTQISPEAVAQQIHDGLLQFSGGGQVYRHSLARRLCFTEGVNHLRNAAAAYWLVDAIASYYYKGGPIDGASDRFRSMHFWKLTRTGEASAVLTAAEDSGFDPVVTQEIPFTDFPFPGDGEFKLFSQGAVYDGISGWLLMLPSEY